ncbi:MAG: hypothetical protein JSW21_03700 [Gammaproteobacteria bacterium]|nr:MAG: hypothetical protein JSW21_03700 [Gammaproteobacteria bacterium]
MSAPEATGQIDHRTFFERPDVFPLEFGSRHLDLVPMTADSYRRSIFTDRGRIVGAARTGWRLDTAEVLAEFEHSGGRQYPVCYVFHIAHCGSTLLARALDIPERTLVIREPFVLRQLGGAAASEGDDKPNPSFWHRCLRLTAGLLGRRYAAEQPVIVKANVPVNFIIDELMALHEGSTGILLYAGVDDYVPAVLKTPRHRRWVRNVTGELAGGIHATQGLGDVRIDKLSDAQAAACLWLAQMRRFEYSLAHRESLRSLDCEELFSRPREVLSAALEFSSARVGQARVAEIASGDLFSRHAKDPSRPYDRDRRLRDMQRLSKQMAGEIEEARAWIQTNGVGSDLKLPLSQPLVEPKPA